MISIPADDARLTVPQTIFTDKLCEQMTLDTRHLKHTCAHTRTQTAVTLSACCEYLDSDLEGMQKNTFIDLYM